MSCGQKCDAPLTAHLEYVEEDPLVYTITFEYSSGDVLCESVWEIGRDLFIEAFKTGCAGSADVILTDSEHGMHVILETDQGTAAMTLRRDGLKAFVRHSMKMIPPGSEDLESLVDEAIRVILP